MQRWQWRQLRLSATSSRWMRIRHPGQKWLRQPRTRWRGSPRQLLGTGSGRSRLASVAQDTQSPEPDWSSAVIQLVAIKPLQAPPAKAKFSAPDMAKHTVCFGAADACADQGWQEVGTALTFNHGRTEAGNSARRA